MAHFLFCGKIFRKYKKVNTLHLCLFQTTPWFALPTAEVITSCSFALSLLCYTGEVTGLKSKYFLKSSKCACNDRLNACFFC